jgi:hypothetical protein
MSPLKGTFKKIERHKDIRCIILKLNIQVIISITQQKCKAMASKLCYSNEQDEQHLSEIQITGHAGPESESLKVLR